MRKSVSFGMPALLTSIFFSLFSISFQTSPCTAAPLATDLNVTNAYATSADDIEDVQDDIHTKVCPILLCQEFHPLRKFKELAMRRKVKVLSECYFD
jgi:hypothetical protein